MDVSGVSRLLIKVACFAATSSQTLYASRYIQNDDSTKRLFMKLLFILTLFFLTLGVENNVVAQVVEFQGFVKTTDGKPIKDVYLSSFGKTDEKGYFKIACDYFIKYWKTITLDKKGFVPKVISLDASNLNLYIVLESEKGSNLWEIPNCSVTETKQNRIVGKYLRLTVPKKLKFKSGVDTDYIYYSIGFKKDKAKYWLRGGLGNLYAGTYPSGETLLGLQNYSYRRTSVGIDWRGITKEGKYWRYFGAVSLFETYHYETESKEATDIFDKILDGVCFQPNEYADK